MNNITHSVWVKHHHQPKAEQKILIDVPLTHRPEAGCLRAVRDYNCDVITKDTDGYMFFFKPWTDNLIFKVTLWSP